MQAIDRMDTGPCFVVANCSGIATVLFELKDCELQYYIKLRYSVEVPTSAIYYLATRRSKRNFDKIFRSFQRNTGCDVFTNEATPPPAGVCVPGPSSSPE